MGMFNEYLYRFYDLYPDQVSVFLIKEARCQTKVAHSASPADPVYVLLDVAGHVEVDDVLHTGDVKTPGSNSCSNYDGSLATFKSKTCMLIYDIPIFHIIHF